MQAARRTILIAGGGIAGLTTALCLVREGWRVDLFEQAQGFETVGAGLQISPNAYRVLDQLGLAKRLKLVATAPTAVRVRAARSGRDLAAVPLGSVAVERYGAPYLVVHRADLQQVLAAAAHEEPEIAMHLGQRMEDATSHANGVTCLAYRQGRMEEFTGSALIAADGVWSRLRARLLDADQPEFTGFIAWRGLVPTDALSGSHDLTNVQLFLHPQVHAVTYPVRGGRYINLVVVTRHRDPKKVPPGPGWVHEADSGELKQELKGWCAEVMDLVSHRTRWTCWPLFRAPALSSWSRMNVAVTGDAAHAMLPFSAQGAAMAIEDAVVMAAGLRPALEGTATVETCLEEACRTRMERVAKARRLTDANRRLYHLPDGLSLFRNLGMFLLGGQRLLARQDWLYGWTPPTLKD